MIKRIISSLLLSVFLSVPAGARQLPMVFEAVTLASGGGQSSIAVIPRSIPLVLPESGTPDARSVMKIFDSMKTRFPAAYGSATIQIGNGRAAPVTLNLDRTRRENWPLVMAEVFHTLKSFGFKQITAPLYSTRPLDLSMIDAIVLMTVQPWTMATRNDTSDTALVSLDGNRVVSTEMFITALDTGNPEISAIVSKGLGSPLESVRIAAVRALGRQKPTSRELQARSADLAGDKAAGVRGAILELAAARKISLPVETLRAIAESDPDADLKLTAARILAAEGIRDYDHILEVRNLQNRDPGQVAAALRRIKASGRSDTASAVAGVLDYGDETVRDLAVEVLASMKDASVMSRAIASPEVAPRQKMALAVETAGICPMDEVALNWLASSGNTEQASIALINACNSKKAPASGQVRCPSAASPVSILSTLVRRSENVIRERAVECLGTCGDATALDVLVSLIDDPALGSAAQDAAVKVLASQPQNSLLGILAAPGSAKKLRLLALDALAAQLESGQAGQATLTTLKGLMKDQDLAIRRAAVNAMARSSDKATAALVMEGIGDRDEGIRKSAVIAAGRMKGAAAEDVIRKSLEDVSTQVRVAGLEILARSPLPDTRRRLRLLAGNARPEIRKPAVVAFLKTLTPEDDVLRNSFVSTLLYDQVEDIRVIAVRAMEDMTDSQSARAVGALAIDMSSTVRTEVARVLGRMRTEAALAILKKMSSDREASVRLSVVESLGRYPLESSGPILRQMITSEKDPGVRKAITDRLGG